MVPAGQWNKSVLFRSIHRQNVSLILPRQIFIGISSSFGLHGLTKQHNSSVAASPTLSQGAYFSPFSLIFQTTCPLYQKCVLCCPRRSFHCPSNEDILLRLDLWAVLYLSLFHLLMYRSPRSSLLWLAAFIESKFLTSWVWKTWGCCVFWRSDWVTLQSPLSLSIVTTHSF